MDATGEVTVELFVRSLAPRGCGRLQADAIDTLSELVDRGIVDDYEVRIWGDAVPVDGDHPIVREVVRLREWAATNGAELLGVDRRTAGSLVEEARAVTALPTMVLAEYHDGKLACVSPHERDGVVHTIEDRLGALHESTDPDRRVATLVASD